MTTIYHIPRPSIGRIVLYHVADGGEVLRAGAYPAIVAGTPEYTRAGTREEGLVDLVVFAGGTTIERTDIRPATHPTPGRWTWPPRVDGLIALTDEALSRSGG